MAAIEKGTFLFVKAQPDLVALLERSLQRRMEKQPGVRISRSDLIRGLLYDALKKEEIKLAPAP